MAAHNTKPAMRGELVKHYTRVERPGEPERNVAQLQPKRVEDRIVEIAGRQHGLVTRAQLREAGMSMDRVRWWVRVRRLQAKQRGVYQLGPLEAARAREMAAVLACGAGAVLSHRSAGDLWQLTSPAASTPIEVTVLGADRGRRPGVRAHRVRRLWPDEVTQLENIPITTVTRTILDLASEMGSAELRQVLALAAREHGTDAGAIVTLLKRYPKRPGTALLRALLSEEGPPALTRSQAEERLLALIRKAQLPRPEVNVRFDRFEIDFLWKEQRLAIEVDGFGFHASRVRFENDRRRDATLAGYGFRVMRVTWRQIEAEPEALLVRVALALLRPGRET